MLRTRLDCFQTHLVLQAANVPEPRCARRTGKAVCCGRSRAQTQRIFRRGPKDDGVGNPCKCRVAVFLRPRGAKEPGEQRTKSHEQNQDDSSKRAVCACSLDLRLPSHLPAALPAARTRCRPERPRISTRSEEHTSELQSRGHLVCRLLLEKKKYTVNHRHYRDAGW